MESSQHMEIKMTPIGVINEGIDGRDAYFLLKRMDDNILTPDMAHDWLLPQVYRECHHAGGYYCTSVKAVQMQYSESEVICLVEHRYDI